MRGVDYTLLSEPCAKTDIGARHPSLKVCLAYDLVMRRVFLCFLLCLMPLRLWAGAWMPTVEALSHPAFATPTDSTVQPGEAHATHHGHETQSEAMNMAHAQPAWLTDASDGNADCHDGTCQLCGVCHQSLSLLVWALPLPVFQAHPLPISTMWAHVARMSAPLIKPPIS
jgi:hypothetical protein